MADAIRYALNHRDGLVGFLEDGRIELDTNSVERAARPVALGRKNALFAGCDEGAEAWAAIASLIETCKLNAVDPQRCLTDLLTRLAGVLANGDPDTDWRAKKDVNAVCDEATEAASASKGASAGTGFHALTEAIDRGEEPLYVPPADAPRLDAYRTATQGYTALAMETFVVCDELQAAGSFDRLWRCPDGRIRVGDLKTGKSEADYPLATTVQLAIYANSRRYDPETHARTPLHDEIDLTTGLLVHMPPSGGCRVIPLDIEKGWRAARTAANVHQIRRLKAADLIKEATP